MGDRGVIDSQASHSGEIIESTTATKKAPSCSSYWGRRCDWRFQVETEAWCGKDSVLWKRSSGLKKRFPTKETWQLIKLDNLSSGWAKRVWFQNATPKFFFIKWFAALDRLATMAWMVKWNRCADVKCQLCSCTSESRDHIFLRCTYSSHVWEQNASCIMCSNFQMDGILSWTSYLTQGWILSTFLLLLCSANNGLCAMERTKLKKAWRNSQLNACSNQTHRQEYVWNRLSNLTAKGESKYENILQY